MYFNSTTVFLSTIGPCQWSTNIQE